MQCFVGYICQNGYSVWHFSTLKLKNCKISDGMIERDHIFLNPPEIFNYPHKSLFFFLRFKLQSKTIIDINDHYNCMLLATLAQIKLYVCYNYKFTQKHWQINYYFSSIISNYIYI